MRQLNLAVIGLGIGRCHAKVLSKLEGVRCAAVAELAPEQQGLDLEDFAGRLGARPYRDGRKLLERESIDGVVIAVPPAARSELLAIAMRRKIAIFVEKPLAADFDRGTELLASFEGAAPLPIMVDFCLRHLPAVRRLRELLDGELGRPLLGSADLVLPRHDSPGWVWSPENGNGLINENTCHLFDVVHLMFGDPVSVYAAGGSYLGAPLEDGVTAVLRFADGATATLVGGGLGAAALSTPARLCVYTEHGQAILSGRDHMFNELVWSTAEDEEAHREIWPLPGRGDISRDALEHFVAGLRTGTPVEPGPEAGLMALAFARSVRESLASRHEVSLALP